MNNAWDDYDAFGPACDLCGAEMVREQCWCCHGAGGFHDCGEDCCCCACPEDDLNERCGECDGEGSYWQCPALPHAAPSATAGLGAWLGEGRHVGPCVVTEDDGEAD